MAQKLEFPSTEQIYLLAMISDINHEYINNRQGGRVVKASVLNLSKLNS